MDTDDTRRIKSVSRTFDIVEQLMDHGEAGVTELAESLDMPASTVHNYLNTLEDRGYVVQEGTRYRPSSQFIHLGDHARHRMEVFRVGESSIGWLAERTDRGSANLIVEEQGRGFYVVSRTNANALRNYSLVRRREYLHSTAAGRAILSRLPERRVDEVIDRHGLPAKTDHTITDRAELEAKLEVVDDRGYAFNDEENTEGIRAVGAPIQRGDGSVAAVSLSGPVNRFTTDTCHGEFADLVRDVAKSIEVDLVS